MTTTIAVAIAITVISTTSATTGTSCRDIITSTTSIPTRLHHRCRGTWFESGLWLTDC